MRSRAVFLCGQCERAETQLTDETSCVVGKSQQNVKCLKRIMSTVCALTAAGLVISHLCIQ